MRLALAICLMFAGSALATLGLVWALLEIASDNGGYAPVVIGALLTGGGYRGIFFGGAVAETWLMNQRGGDESP